MLVVHAQVSIAEALAVRLRREPGLEVLDAVSRSSRALALVAARSVDAVVLDWDLPDGGARLTGLLRALERPPRVVLLGDGADPATLVEALRTGAGAWLPSSGRVDDLLEALRVTRRGEIWLPSWVLGPVLRHLMRATQGPPAGPLDALTDREREVLQCMVAGLDQSAIAAELYLSPNTVRTHRRRTLAKLGVHSSLEAVFVARRAGLTCRAPAPS